VSFPGDPVETNVIAGVLFQKYNTAVHYESTVPISFVINLPPLPPATPVDGIENCAAQPVFCGLMNRTANVQRLIYHQLIQSHPYFASSSTSPRSERGFLDFLGEIQHQVIGVATDRDVNELHVGIDYIKKHEKELEEATQINTNATASLAKNITAFDQQWNDAVKDNVSSMRSEMAKATSTTTRDGTTLGRSIEIINQNEYYLFTATRLELAAADCWLEPP
jgi:hypothetical protein